MSRHSEKVHRNVDGEMNEIPKGGSDGERMNEVLTPHPTLPYSKSQNEANNTIGYLGVRGCVSSLSLSIYI